VSHRSHQKVGFAVLRICERPCATLTDNPEIAVHLSSGIIMGVLVAVRIRLLLLAFLCSISCCACIANYIPEQKKLSPYIQKESVCKIHREELKIGVVKIEYGLMQWEDEYDAAMKHLFPNSIPIVSGGCIGRMFPRWALILYCSKCRSEEKEWHKQHPSHFNPSPQSDRLPQQ
jgi:hypothetical protein